MSSDDRSDGDDNTTRPVLPGFKVSRALAKGRDPALLNLESALRFVIENDPGGEESESDEYTPSWLHSLGPGT